MPNSYNGWSAGRGWTVENGKLTKLIVGNETFSPGVRSGSVHTVLNYVAHQLHLRVEPVIAAGWHNQDDWGYYYRPTTGGGSLSCHASGTAFDYNATRHPYGKKNTWNDRQVAEIKKICAEVGNTVKCLIDKDEMHFEICASVASVNAVAVRLRSGSPAPRPSPIARPVIREGDNSQHTAYLQSKLRITVDRKFGPKTKLAVVAFQRAHGLVPDGVVGPNTWRALG